jgi:hypothetical protein
MLLNSEQQVDIPDQNGMDVYFEDTLDKIEVGLEAFEKLLALATGMSKVKKDYDVFKEIEYTYNQEGHQIVKDFIKMGLELVRGHPDCFTKQPEFNVKFQESVQLSQMDSAHEGMDTLHRTHVKAPKEEVAMETKQSSSRKNKSKRSKEKRKNRLLKFHQKLVQMSGLPPSRLMLEQTPLSNKNMAKLNRKKLNFYDLTPGPAHGPPPIPAVPAPAAAQPHIPYQPSTPVCRNGIFSTTYSLPSLHSISQSSVGGYGQGLSQSPGYGVGGVSGVSTVWPDARTFSGGLCGSPELYVGSSSNLNQHHSLSPSYQPSVGLCQSNSPIGRPAYCFHCLQYGSVYTISPV